MTAQEKCIKGVLALDDKGTPRFVPDADQGLGTTVLLLAKARDDQGQPAGDPILEATRFLITFCGMRRGIRVHATACGIVAPLEVGSNQFVIWIVRCPTPVV